jgi:hypothetical protein
MPAHRPAAVHDAAVPSAGEVTFASFTSLALVLGAWAREHALQVPQYRSPPRSVGLSRSLRRVPGCRPVVSIRLRGRARSEVVRDMVEGLLAVNARPGPGIDGPGTHPALRDAAIEHLLGDSLAWSCRSLPHAGARHPQASRPAGSLAA